jgi:hypothetical protein
MIDAAPEYLVANPSGGQAIYDNGGRVFFEVKVKF